MHPERSVVGWRGWFLVFCLQAIGPAAAETVTLNGKTYEVATENGYPPKFASADVEIDFFGAVSRSRPDDPADWHWLLQADVKHDGDFAVTVTTPLDESVSTIFDAVGPGSANVQLFDSVKYPTLWTWLQDPGTSWFPFVLSFKNEQSGVAFEVTQWLRFDPKEKEVFASLKRMLSIRPSPDKALVYVLRDDYAILGRIDVFIDETPVALLPKKSYVALEVEPGWHLVWGECPAEWFELEAGRTYLLRTALVGQGGFNSQCDEWWVDNPAAIPIAILERNLEPVVLTEESLVELRERLSRYARAQKKAGEAPAGEPAESAALLIDPKNPPSVGAMLFARGKGTLAISDTTLSYKSSQRNVDVPRADIRSMGLGLSPGNNLMLTVQYDQQGTAQTLLFELWGARGEQNRVLMKVLNSQPL